MTEPLKYPVQTGDGNTLKHIMGNGVYDLLLPGLLRRVEIAMVPAEPGYVNQLMAQHIHHERQEPIPFPATGLFKNIMVIQTNMIKFITVPS